MLSVPAVVPREQSRADAALPHRLKARSTRLYSRLAGAQVIRIHCPSPRCNCCVVSNVKGIRCPRRGTGRPAAMERHSWVIAGAGMEDRVGVPSIVNFVVSIGLVPQYCNVAVRDAYDVERVPARCVRG